MAVVAAVAAAACAFVSWSCASTRSALAFETATAWVLSSMRASNSPSLTCAPTFV